MAWHDEHAEVGDCPFCGFPVLLPAGDAWRCPSCDAEGRRRLPEAGPRTGRSGRSGWDR
jgi:hypothetical protein